MNKNQHKRSAFSGKIGFVLSAAGASVGLGNIWRFPYLAAKYGGGTFLITYLLLVFTFGVSLLLLETALGRKTGQSAIGAFKQFGTGLFGGRQHLLRVRAQRREAVAGLVLTGLLLLKLRLQLKDHVVIGRDLFAHVGQRLLRLHPILVVSPQYNRELFHSLFLSAENPSGTILLDLTHVKHYCIRSRESACVLHFHTASTTWNRITEFRR